MKGITYHIFVGTKNQHKLNAVKRTFMYAGYKHVLHGIDINSGVPNQPLNKQIVEGAINQCRRLETDCEKIKCLEQLDKIDEPYKVIYVGIESGIKEDKLNGGYYETTVIAMLYDIGERNIRVTYTEPVYIYDRYDHLIDEVKTHQQEITFGKLFSQFVKRKYGLNISSDNWYSHMRGQNIDRYEMIYCGLKSMVIPHSHSI